MGLHNHYTALRHGEADHNVRGVIASKLPEDSRTVSHLTESGRESVRNNVQQAIDNHVLDKSTPIVIVCSPFLRTRQSAGLAHTVITDAGLTVDPHRVQVRDAWRERDFGDLNGQSADRYFEVWRHDTCLPGESIHNVETANAVQAAVALDIAKLEALFKQRQILVCSHGDTLQIAQTLFEDTGAENHRNMPMIRTAELRKLN